MSCHYFEISAARPIAAPALNDPLRHRITLPARLLARGRFEFRGRLSLRRRRSKMQDARLRSLIGLDLQRVIVLPGDVQVGGLPHHARRAVRLALVALGFVLRRVPLHRQFRARFVVRNVPACRRVRLGAARAAESRGRPRRSRAEVALGSGQHPFMPVFGDHRRPISGDVDGRGNLRYGRRAASPASCSLGVDRRRQGKREHQHRPQRRTCHSINHSMKAERARTSLRLRRAVHPRSCRRWSA